jgi:UDP-N-acetylmuramoyl-tripeptide--D-alanyl-D-alanine ligase
MRWTLEEVARALGVARPGGLDSVTRLAGVSIDSRTVGAGELFVAIHGPRHDGHAFVAAALERGALAVVVDTRRAAEFPGWVRDKLFEVTDTLAALQRLAHAVRRAWGLPAAAGKRLAGVAGSVGKTTTKEILAALLAARFRVLKSEGNLNNEFGVPLTLLRLDDTHEAAVAELGMSHRGELARLAQIAEPQVGVVTCVAVEHLEFFSSLDEIARAERELIENLAGPDPVAVLNVDDERVARFVEITQGRVIRFGLGSRAHFRAERIDDRGASGTAFDFVWPEGRARLELPLVGVHNVRNAIAALAAASVWGVGAPEAAQVFPKLEPVALRGEVLRFAAGFTVLNDAYNSSPTALAMLEDWLVSAPGYRRRILAAGEMLELGPTSPELHREAGRHAARSRKIDWIVAVQGAAEEIVRGAVEAGHPAARTRFFANSEEAAAFLTDFVAAGDLVLIKGSRGVRMEKIVEALKAGHALAGEPASAGVSAGRKDRG